MNEKELTKYRRDVIGFVFQKYNLIDDLTVEENIRIAASLVNNSLSVIEVLKMVGLEDKAKKYPSQLSGGEQQRVCIARALVKQASIIICDEPTGALDTENALRVVRLLQKLAKEQAKNEANIRLAEINSDYENRIAVLNSNFDVFNYL